MATSIIKSPQFYTSWDTNARNYLLSVEQADGQTLERDVWVAVNTFVVRCKSDGIWNAVKASCILAGARTLAGALVPLVGTSPTNSGLVSGNYNRKTGILNATGGFINTNRNNTSDAGSNKHCAIYLTTFSTPNQTYMMGGNTHLYVNASKFWVRATAGYAAFNAPGVSAGQVGLYGFSRADGSGNYTGRYSNQTITHFEFPQSATSASMLVYPSTSRMSFYSIGSSLDLVKLGSRIATLMTTLNSAIP